MNSTQLLAHFNRIAEAPDAIQRLRRFILDLAVRGKLVEQDGYDEPAAVLLKRIRAEKANLAKEGGIRSGKPLPSLAEDELPFRIPKSWCWSQLAEIGFVNPRNSAGDDLQVSFIPMSLISSEYGVAHTQEIRPWGEVKNGYTHFSEGDIGLAKITPCFENGKSTVFRDLTGGIGAGTTELHVVRPVRVSAEYIVIFLKCPHFIESGISRMTGTAGQKRVPAEYFANSAFPLPPLAEQVRIVAKVSELMALCDGLEEAMKQREVKRRYLVAASLANLITHDPDRLKFADHGQFVLDNLAAITKGPEQVKHFRQTILNLAVRGRLVPQDPDDEPASQLIREIDLKRKKLYASKKIPKPTQLPSISESDIAFPIPLGWSWAMLGDLCYQVSDGPHFSPQYVGPNEGVPFLSTRNVRPEGFELSSVKYVSRSDHEAFCKRIRPEKGDIIYTKGGTTGIAKVNDLDFEFSVWVHLAVLRIEKERLFPRYVELVLNSPHCYGQSQQYTRGISNFDLGLTRMVKITIPLPPLSEQRRIVAKVDQLMALCSRLEALLVTAQSERSRLLDAILNDAFNDTQTPDDNSSVGMKNSNATLNDCNRERAVI